MDAEAAITDEDQSLKGGFFFQLKNNVYWGSGPRHVFLLDTSSTGTEKSLSMRKVEVNITSSLPVEANAVREILKLEDSGFIVVYDEYYRIFVAEGSSAESFK